MLYGEIKKERVLVGYLQQEVINLGEREKQTKTIIPTEERQSAKADTGYELAEVIVEPIPSEYEIPVLYDGIVEVTPTKESQSLGTADKKLTQNIVINPIPDKYADVSNVDATAEDVMMGKTFVDNQGNEVQGTAELKEDLDAELTAQDEAITRLEVAVDELPESKADIDEVKLMDLFDNIFTGRPIVERDYTDKEIKKLDRILANITQGEVVNG